MVNKIVLSICVAVLSAGCSSLRLSTDKAGSKAKKEDFKVDVEQTLGVIGLNSVIEFTKEDTIRLLNVDGSLWYKFSYYYDDSDGKYDFYSQEFRPYMFNPDYALLGLIVTQELPNGKFKVVVNHIESMEKYIQLEDYLVFRSWPDQVLNAFSISYNQADNPLKKRSSNTSQSILSPEDVFFHPVKTENQWLQVKWGKGGNEEYGWIKWKEDGFLVVALSPYS